MITSPLQPLARPRVDGTSALAAVPQGETALGASVSYDATIRLEGISRRMLYERIRSGRYSLAPSGDVAKNGKPVQLIEVASLSPEGQARYVAQLQDAELAAQTACDLPTPSPARLAEIASPGRGAPLATTDSGALDVEALRAAGKEREAYEADRKMSACARVLELSASGEPKMKAIARAAVESGVSVPTIRAWLSRAKAGHAALAPRWGQNKGRYLRLPVELQGIIRATYLTPQQPTVKQVYRNAVMVWCRARGLAAPSYATVRRFVEREVAPAEDALMRRGKRAWDVEIMATCRRDWNSVPVNSVWCADHRRLDVFVIGPGGRIMRPWVTMFSDCASAGIMGTRLADRPTSQTVATALRSGILRWGVPRVLYFDNGKEFCAKRFGGADFTKFDLRDPGDALLGEHERWPCLPPASLEADYARLQFKQIGVERRVDAIPYSSWSKPIESFLGAFAKQWENLMPGWCGNSVQIRPERLRADADAGRLLTFDQFAEQWAAHVEAWNSNHVCGERTATAQQMHDQQDAAVRRVAEADCDFLLLRRDSVIVPHDGIKVADRRYLSVELGALIGHRVAYSYDPDDAAYIVVRPLARPAERIVVPEIRAANPLAFGQRNILVQHIRKGQRSAVRAVAASTQPYLAPEFVDPSGAWRLAQQNANVPTAGGPASSPIAALRLAPTDVELIAQAKAEGDAKGQADAAAHRNVAASSAAEILAQAASESAWANGESHANP